jgi:putative ABC transport system ATP-binding protein
LLDKPSSGEYFLDQQNTTGMDDTQLASLRRNKIGFIFQFFHLLPRLTAEENISLPMTLEGISPTERHARTVKIMQDTGIADRAKHKPDQLSGGQRQRVAISRAMVMEPGILLADEPTGNLDRHSGSEIVELLEQLNRKGITLIVVTHDPDIGKRATRRIHMIDGKIVNDG